MRVRSIALALALACGFGTMAEAKKRYATPRHAKVKTGRRKSSLVKPRKARRAKVRTAHH